MTPQELIQSYLAHNYRLVFWPAIGDAKGPRESGWPQKEYTLDDYHEGYRVGILTGTEIAPNRFLIDIDIDWSPGSLIAQLLLPSTGFVFGRPGKKISHCFYTTPEPIPSVRYEDIDKTCLIELRGTKTDGEIGLQTMAPPSVWSKNGHREALSFVKTEGPAHLESDAAKRYVLLAAVSLICAKHLGHNGFGHEARLCFDGFLLKSGFTRKEVVEMGKAISGACNNLEIADIERAVNSTADNIERGRKVKAGPALAKLIGANGKAVIGLINEWLGRGTDFARVEGVIVKDSQNNIRKALHLLNKELTYNGFSDKLLVDSVPLEDRQMDEMWLRVDEDFHFRPTFTFFDKVVRKIAWENEFNPVKDYIQGLEWDGVPRIDTWLLECAWAEDSAYLRAVSSIVLMAAVRRIREPGVKYDEMLVLEGAQGLNKSSALRALCPRGEWFSDDLPLNTNSQKVIEATLGKWIIEAADLAGKRKAEIEQLKAMLSRQVDGPARLAYAHLPVERPRQFIIIGTTNSAAYLTDPTGARRFWPVAIKTFNVDRVKKNRDQLWAEAAAKESAGASIRLDEGLWAEATEHQEKRREIDPWETTLRMLLLSVRPGGDGKRRIATEDLWGGLAIQLDRRDRSGALRIAEIMQRLGFRRTTVRGTDGDVQSGYITEWPDLLELRGDGQELVEDGPKDEPPF